MSAVISLPEAVRTLEYRTSEDVVYHLYQNDFPPDFVATLDDYEEATFSNYSAQTVLSTSWTTPVEIDGMGYAGTTSTTVISWLKTGATGNALIYGYYVTRAGVLVGEQDFDSPIPMEDDGAAFSIIPQMFEGTPIP